MTTQTTTQAKRAWMINLMFLSGLSSLCYGIFLMYGLGPALIVLGFVLLSVSLLAVISRQPRITKHVNHPV